MNVVNEEFVVHRNSGDIEIGWTVVSDTVKTQLESGELVDAVTLIRPDETHPGKSLRKIIPIDEFQGWQRDYEQSKRYDALLSREVADDIGSVALGTEVEASTDTYKEALNERYRALFAPIETEDEPANEQDYDYLFDPNYEPPKNVDHSARQKENPRGLVTEANKQKAHNVIEEAIVADPKIRRIIEEQTRLQGESFDPSDLIRTSAEARLAIGTYMLDKISRNLSRMPERVLDDRNKKSDHGGYPEMKSREYVALLVLSMLDGTFDYSREQHIYDFDDRGVATLGQHRYAARYLLEH